MRLSTAAFNWLPSRALIIAKQSVPGRAPVNHLHDNPVITIAKFARFMGLTQIPAGTVEKLKTDPYYKYCFFILRNDYSIYGVTNAPQVQARLKELLLSPEAVTDRDLYFGIRDYMNNFPGYMPGGFYRTQYEQYLNEFPEFAGPFKAVNSILGTKEREKAQELLAAADQERCDDEANFSRRLAYLRFCLGCFELLMKRGFSPEELWR
jgi:hypothetical protein